MSRSFGDTGPVGTVNIVSGDDVYIWRAKLSSRVESAADALLLVQAVGRYMRDNQGYHVRGVAVSNGSVDVVLTPRAPGLLFFTGGKITAAVLADPDVRARWPVLSADGAFVELIGPEQALDFWRAHDVVYDGVYGPRTAFVEGRGVYQGVADNGHNLKKWQPEKVPLVPDLPVAADKETVAGIGTAGWLAIIAVTGAALWAGAKAFA